jgi:hypothetical protein
LILLKEWKLEEKDEKGKMKFPIIETFLIFALLLYHQLEMRYFETIFLEEAKAL